MIVRSFFVLFSLFITLGSADAHGPERGPNGGQVQDLAGNHVELVMQGDEIVVYLFDAENEPIAAQGVVATATVLASGKQPRSLRCSRQAATCCAAAASSSSSRG